MAVYESGVTAVRDTTKWLTAFVPVTSITAAVVVSGPGLVRSIRSVSSVGEWVAQWGLVAISGVALFAAIGALLYSSARVLTVAPVDLADLQNNESTRAAVARAFGSGAVLPYYFDKPTFDADLALLGQEADAQTLAVRLARLGPAMELVRQWSVYDRVQKPYACFRRTFIGATMAIVIALVVAPAQLSSLVALDEPLRVRVELNEAGVQELTTSTGCRTSAGSTFYLVGGTWEAPRLALDGPGCRFGALWSPRPEDVEVRPSGK